MSSANAAPAVATHKRATIRAGRRNFIVCFSLHGLLTADRVADWGRESTKKQGTKGYIFKVMVRRYFGAKVRKTFPLLSLLNHLNFLIYTRRRPRKLTLLPNALFASQFGVFGLRFFEHRRRGIGVFPEPKKILIGLLGRG